MEELESTLASTKAKVQDLNEEKRRLAAALQTSEAGQKQLAAILEKKSLAQRNLLEQHAEVRFANVTYVFCYHRPHAP